MNKAILKSLSATMVFIVTLFIMTIDAPISKSTSEEGRTYCVHTCSSSVASSVSSTYNLSPNLSISSGGDSLQSIIGEPNFVPTTEQAIVRLEDSNGNAYGTGFIVGKHVIATAAHCVYGRSAGTFFNFTIKVTNSQNQVINTITPTEIHIPEKYHNSSETSPWLYDYALIYVYNEINVNSYGKFSLGTATEDFVSSSSELYAAGFVGSNGSNYGLQYGNLLNVWNKYEAIGNTYSPYPYAGCQYMLRFTADIVAGESGGPVYINDDLYVNGNLVTQKTALAIVTQEAGSHNDSIRITPEIILFYSQYS